MIVVICPWCRQDLFNNRTKATHCPHCNDDVADQCPACQCEHCVLIRHLHEQDLVLGELLDG